VDPNKFRREQLVVNRESLAIAFIVGSLDASGSCVRHSTAQNARPICRLLDSHGQGEVGAL
jgi:hypothetical protein